jgi:IS30 family transposase
VPRQGPTRYLHENDRIHIADRLGDRATIGGELGRHPSTVSREIRRNAHPDNGQYRPLVVATGRHPENPAGHRDRDPIGGELTDHRVDHFGRTFSLAK